MPRVLALILCLRKFMSDKQSPSIRDITYYL